MKEDRCERHRVPHRRHRAGGTGVGEPYTFADGVVTSPILQQPVFVFEASTEKIQTVAGRAVRRDMTAVAYPESIFATNNRATVLALAFDEVRMAGIAVRGPAAEVDRVIKSATSRHLEPGRHEDPAATSRTASDISSTGCQATLRINSQTKETVTAQFGCRIKPLHLTVHPTGRR
jgi:hypothetical protein